MKWWGRRDTRQSKDSLHGTADTGSYDKPLSTFLSAIVLSTTLEKQRLWLTPLRCFMANICDKFLKRWNNLQQSATWWIILQEINLISVRSHCRIFQVKIWWNSSVHIFNCTKIPLTFASNKLSETNGISNPSLVMTLQQFGWR